MQPLPPKPVRPVYTRAWSSDRSELPYLQPDPEALPLPYNLPRPPTRPGRAWAMHPQRSLDFFDRPIPARRPHPFVVPELQLNNEAMPRRRESEALEALEVDEPIPPDRRSPVVTQMFMVLTGIVVAAIPALLAYGGYRLIKKAGE